MELSTHVWMGIGLGAGFALVQGTIMLSIALAKLTVALIDR